MADLTGQGLTMLLVHFNCITRYNFGMAVNALRVFCTFQTVIRSRRGICCAMQVGTFMAFHAIHACFTEVDIARYAFVLSEEFIPYTAAVAGRA